MKKKIFISSIAVLIVTAAAVVFASVDGARSGTRPYYKGDAINYNGNLIIGSTNMGSLEIFKVEGGNIKRTARIILFAANIANGDTFYDVVFIKENGSLYAFTVDGKNLYKYDISDLSRPQLVKKVSDNSKDWFGGVEKRGDKIATIGVKGVKIWNRGLDIIDSYNLPRSDYQYNLTFNRLGDFIFDIRNGALTVFDAFTRQNVAKVLINTKEEHNRKAFNLANHSSIYVVDDASLKKISFSGMLLKELKHTSGLGYDVVGSTDGNYVYFSDGIGVVKAKSDDLKIADWAYTGKVGGGNGWAMGLRLASVNGADNLVVFNNSNILVLNDKLDKVASYKSVEEAAPARETVFLRVDKNRAAPNSYVFLQGGGYAPNEDLDISFAGFKIFAVTDANGRFSRIIQVPVAASGGADIKVVGKNSGVNYSIGFRIE